MESLSDALAPPDNSPKGLGAAARLFGVVLMIASAVDFALGHSISGLDSVVTLIIGLALSGLTIISGHLLIKGKKLGYILGWTVSMVMIVYGGLMLGQVIKNNVGLIFFFMLWGLLMACFLASPKTRKGLQ